MVTTGGERRAKRKGVFGPVLGWEMGIVSCVGPRFVRFGQLGKISLEY